MKKITLLILITLFTISAFAADGDLDGTFGTGGKVVTGNFFEEGGRDVAIQPDGKIIAVGAKTSNFNSGNMAAVRYNADGSLDTNFGSGGVFVLPLAAPEYAAGKAIAVEVLPDGKILLGGSGRTLTSINQIYLIIRLNANGTLDTTFGTNGRAIYDFGNNNAYGGFAAMVFDASRSKIYVSATRAIDINNAIYGYDITRFNDNGTLDTSFNGTGSQTFRIGDSFGTFTHLFDIALQADGKIVATGGIQYIRSSDNQSIESFGTARVNVDGSLDSSFGTNGIVITDYPSDSNILYSAVARTVSLLPDGRIFIGGSGGTGSGGSLRDFYFAARLDINGSPDSSFGTGGKIRAEAVPIADSVITPGGKIIITGIKNGIFGVGRLNSNGTIDTTFGTNGVVQTAFRVGTPIQENPFAIALQPDGKIVVAGGENNPNTSGPGQDYNLLARYNGTAVTVNNPALRIADFDGDGKSDASVFRNGTWYINPSSAPSFASNSFYGVQFGLATDKLAPADYDGDGKTDVAVWRESEQTFYILQSSNGAVRVENFGLVGDVLTVGDYDGDGKADLSVYREGAQSYFFYRASANNPNGSITFIPWGTGGDKSVRGDFDGDGKLDTAVYRASNQTWYIRNSSNGQTVYTTFGLPSDKRISGDFDGDGKTDITVFRDGVWYILQSSNNQIRYQNWGATNDLIVAADYDGDGKTDFAVWRNGIYYILNSGNSSVSYQNFGTSGDKTIASAYVQ